MIMLSIEGRGGGEVSETPGTQESPKTNDLSYEVNKRNNSELEDINKPSSGSDYSSKPSLETHPENERLPDKSDSRAEKDYEPVKQNSEMPDEKNRLPENSNEKPQSETKSYPEIHNENRELPKENEPLEDKVKTTEPKSTEQPDSDYATEDNKTTDKEHPQDNNSLEKDAKIGNNKDTEQSKNDGQPEGNDQNSSSGNIEPTNEDTDQPVKRIPTKNEKLEGSQHPETGVPFDAKTVKNSEGEPVEAVVPEFESTYDTQLPEGAYRANDKSQFDYCNSQLNDAAFNPKSEKYDPELAGKFTPEQQDDIKDEKTPEGYTWHHDAEPGKMQLVDSETHADTGHTGGRTIWGGGGEYR